MKFRYCTKCPMKSMQLIIILFSFILRVFSQKEIQFEIRANEKNWEDAKKSCDLSRGQLFMPDSQEIWDKFNGYYVNQYGKYKSSQPVNHGSVVQWFPTRMPRDIELL